MTEPDMGTWTYDRNGNLITQQSRNRKGFNHEGPGAASGRNQIRNTNIEQGISNDEAFLSFDVHYSLVDICYLDKSLGKEMIQKYAGQSESFDRQIELLKKGMYDSDYKITWWVRLKDKIIFLLDKYNILHL